MPDAWETLTANATDTSDAWAALNSQGCSGIIGRAVDEINFRLELKEITYTPQPITIKSIIGIIESNYDTDIGSITILED